MLAVAWHHFGAWPGRFGGSLVALTLGVALIAATGLVLRAQAVADPPPTLRDAYAELGALMGLMAGVSGFGGVFVIAGTAGLAVMVRRRALARVRATPHPARRMILSEALIAGLVGALLGDVLAWPVGEAMVAGLHRLGVGPTDVALRTAPGPVIFAGLVGMAMALAGMWLAARRTRTVHAVEALRPAAVEPRRMAFSRWLFAGPGLGGGIAMPVAAARTTGVAGSAVVAARPRGARPRGARLRGADGRRDPGRRAGGAQPPPARRPRDQ